ncbi:MAG TPA: SBBP repeat-containing protein, partial [Verrucomicrobium sp.]|nr:SBBP repeat-containing protein [Verrucomicrobium sp.]
MRLPAIVRLFVLTSLMSGLAPAQTFKWVATAGGTKSDKTRCVALDPQGNVLLAGEMNGDGKFGPITTAGAGNTDFFLAKVNKAGQFVWARTLGGSQVDRGYGVAADAVGNIYVTGHYQSQDLMALGQPVPNAGDYDVFTAKYDPAGQLLWIRTAGGKGYDYGHGIAADHEGNVIVTGAVVGEAKFGEMTLSSPRSIFCAKYDAGGRLLWVKGSTGPGSGAGHGVAVDGKGNIYLGGLAAGTCQFGKFPVGPSKTNVALVAALNSEGEVQWVQTLPASASAVVHEITADAEGRVWVAGIFKG